MTYHAGLTWTDVLDRMDPTFVVADVEHDASKEVRIPGNGASLGVAIAGFEKNTTNVISHYFPYRHLDFNAPKDVQDRLKEFLENVKYKIYFNAKNDLVTLADLGISTAGEFIDPQSMDHWINGKLLKPSLDVISKLHGGNPKSMSAEMKEIINTGGPNQGWGQVPYFMMREYAANDAKITFELFIKLWPQFKRFMSLWKVEQEFIREFLIRIERIGIRLNKNLCLEEKEFGEERMEEIITELGLNPSSPKDMEELFVRRLKLGIAKLTPKGKPSFDKSALAEYDIILNGIDSPVAKMVKEFRGWQKTLSSNYDSYLNTVGRDGRVRPSYHIVNTPTSRLAASKPALQQIPRLSTQPWNGNVRNVFIPASGYTLWDIDYSQIELRVIAHYIDQQFGNNELAELLNDPKRHIFKEMSARLGWDYNNTKTMVYSISYGADIDRIKEIFGVDTEVARNIKEQLFRAYPEIEKLLTLARIKFMKKKYIKLWTGREVRNRLTNKPHAAMNYLSQGGGAEIVKRAALKVAKKIDWLDCRAVLQVHDSIVFEIRNGTENYWLPIIKEIMEEPPHERFVVKFPVGIKKWGTEDEINIADL